MRISSTKSRFYNSCQNSANRLSRRAKVTISKLEQKKSFVYTPIKYYLVGLAIPIPFASTIGLIWGLGKAIYDRIKHFLINKKSS